MVEVHQRIGGGFERLLSQVPSGAPGEGIGGDLGQLGHAGKSKIAALRQQRGIEDRQKVVTLRFTTVEMAQVPAEAHPSVDFDEQIEQVSQG
jgi:hypothetical protein